MLIPFGILSAAAQVEPAFLSDYELISTTILGSAAASVTFSSLGDYSSTYKHLQIRATGRTDRTTLNSDFLRLRFNGDTGSNYALHALLGNGSAVASVNVTSTVSISVERFGSDATTGYFGAAVVDILDAYSTTKNKTVRSFGGAAGATPNVVLNSGVYLNTSSTTSLTLAVGGGTNILTGSRFSLYGIKG
jgi:hypothetical protein